MQKNYLYQLFIETVIVFYSVIKLVMSANLTVPKLQQDFGKSVNPISEVIALLRQDSIKPTKYKQSLDEVLQEPYNESGFEQVRLDTCERAYVFGDVHARCEQVAQAIEDIEKSCIQRGTDFASELSSGKVALFFVGDLVHAEKNIGNYQLAQSAEDKKKIAEENLNTVLGVMRLKSLYPKSVFIVSGNHDENATIEGGVGKNGIDQGSMLKGVLHNSECDESLQAVLDRLPLMAGVHIKDKHIVMTHALPLPEGGLSGILQRINQAVRPYVADIGYIRAMWGETREISMNRIRNRVDELTKLFHWGKIMSPTASAGANLPLGEVIRVDEELLKQRGLRFVQNYLFLLMRHLFYSSKAGQEIMPSDVLWIVGHEQTSMGMRNIIDSIASTDLKDKGVKIAQVNSYSQLPVVSLNIKNWDKDDFISIDKVKQF